MLTQMESEKQLFDGYLDTAADLLSPAGIPIFATRGNHENRGSASHRFLDYFPDLHRRSLLRLPAGSGFVVLDCGEDKPDSDIRYYGTAATDAYRAQEAEWLRRVVAKWSKARIPLCTPARGRPAHDPGREKQLARRTGDPPAVRTDPQREPRSTSCYAGTTTATAGSTTGSRGTNFPILINSNRDKLVVKADRRDIDLEVIDPGGEVIKRHRIDKSA